tara:strand:- start:1434 stop:2045 length:612 start_codon:yes stop_codon:yes gene_type:complete
MRATIFVDYKPPMEQRAWPHESEHVHGWKSQMPHDMRELMARFDDEGLDAEIDDAMYPTHPLDAAAHWIAAVPKEQEGDAYRVRDEYMRERYVSFREGAVRAGKVAKGATFILRLLSVIFGSSAVGKGLTWAAAGADVIDDIPETIADFADGDISEEDLEAGALLFEGGRKWVESLEQASDSKEPSFAEKPSDLAERLRALKK